MDNNSVPDWVIGLGLGVLGSVIASIIFVWIRGMIKKRSAPKPGVETKDGHHDLDDPAYLLGIRADKKFGYDPYYHRREYLDDEIYKRIDNFKSLLVTGAPLAGKTRALYEALKKLKPQPFVIMPSIQDIQDEKYPDPQNITTTERTILLFDDIHKYTVRDSMAHHLRQYQKKGAIVIATCRKGPEYDRLCDSMKDHLTIFGEPIEIEVFEREEAEDVAKDTNRNVPDTFDGTIGSIFVPLQEIMERYKDVSYEGKKLLQSIKCLYDAGIYNTGEDFVIEHIRKVYTEIEKMTATEDQWQDVLRRLEQKGFYRISCDTIQIEETYLQKVIPNSFNDPDDLLVISKVFNDDFNTLHKIRTTTYNRGLVDVRKAAYQKMAIEICGQSLILRPFETSPEHYAMTQINLGTAYSTLAEVEDKASNCRAAITAFGEALTVYTLERLPMGYGMTQNNLGNAYRTLAEIEEPASNCRAAISAYEKALTVRTPERFPMQYAMTQTNLGGAYKILAQVKDPVSNCQAAISAYEKALKVYTLERYPRYYATTQNNLGNAYRQLAEAEVDVEKKVLKCRAAISAFEKALKVRTRESFPMDYAMTQNNLGNAYSTLAPVREKAAHCRMAISAFEKAIKVFTLETFPMQYAMTLSNMGNAYSILADVEEPENNSRAAISAYEKALTVYTLERFPMDYAMTQNNIMAAYGTLAMVEDKAQNYKMAKRAFDEALKVYTKEKLPLQHQRLIHNLSVLEEICGS